ncbi:MAG: thioredoxin family protein [Fidelibacterota bacterium]
MNLTRNLILTGLLIISLLMMGCSDGQAEKSDEAVQNAEKSLPKLLDLGAHECIPCKKMAPILDEMTAEYKGVLDVEFVDVWQPENKAIAQKHGIQSIPTQIYFDENGKEIWRHVGFISKEDMLAKWAELGYDFEPQQ